MSVPYESSGRIAQKSRTRRALVESTRRLLADGKNPTVEESAAAAGISRTTAYRYFPNQEALLIAAHPEIEHGTLLPEHPPADVDSRFDHVVREFTRLQLEWEPQLRMSLRMSLTPDNDAPPLRRGRAIGWFEEALAPLRDSHPGTDIHKLAIAVRSATGIEALIWLIDVAGLSRDDAVEVMRWTAHAQLDAARKGH
ncbi:TetR/AcrR family transcriptional regulator [Nocardia sp. BMG111209]|uniref:TetR/AcrR family transcriptional regulator n=1 Tax=Nocardia sp. BMG111209 TaxID=1160137 RepID=UPI000362A2AF|nr:TetR/AcrR family transcriptional regulator [Nocardia sp. BMG111209]